MDEESCGFRALNLAYGPLSVRGAPIPECAHPAWNDSSRALQSSGLKPSVLKGTVLVNNYKGPFHSGRNGYSLQEAAQRLAATCSDEFLSELSLSYGFDTGLPDVELTREAFLSAPGIATRLPAAP